MQASIGTDEFNRDGRAVITTSIVDGCEVAMATCFADANRDTLVQVFVGGVPYILNGGCGTADLPPNLITCNAAGNWVFAITGEINPTIQCSVTTVGPDC
ncbi:unnamed protein product [Cylicocyclus nassatus]|uniref:Uncharacterized protein n=1 Tax=Cylicocyclus nassatus TaxID=53992 RepID=A0AA36M522_CYLNA|nr:unnamed protein product [Cylicocyclus nassatus]